MVREKQWKIDSHKHASYEFHFVVSGASVVKTEESTFIIRKNQFYITPPGLSHSQENLIGKNYIEYCLNCSIDELKLYNNSSEGEMIVSVLKNLRCFPLDDSKGISNLFENAFKEASEQRIGYYNSIKSIIMQIIINSVRLANNNDNVTYNIPRYINKK